MQENVLMALKILGSNDFLIIDPSVYAKVSGVAVWEILQPK